MVRIVDHVSDYTRNFYCHPTVFAKIRHPFVHDMNQHVDMG